jgi:glutathione S-transferase
MYHYTALVTLLAALFYLYTSTQVSRARIKYGVKLPAIAGNADFERVFRVQMNTLEWLPIFLPSLWLFAIYISDWGAAIVGVVWIAGRIAYMVGYTRSAPQRGPGFLIQSLATAVLLFGALGMIVRRIVHG